MEWNEAHNGQLTQRRARWATGMWLCKEVAATRRDVSCFVCQRQNSTKTSGSWQPTEEHSASDPLAQNMRQQPGDQWLLLKGSPVRFKHIPFDTCPIA